MNKIVYIVEFYSGGWRHLGTYSYKASAIRLARQHEKNGDIMRVVKVAYTVVFGRRL